MATECDTTGVIVKTSKNSCVVSVTIDGNPQSYSFSKRVFYSFGERCDGDMTNLLDDDMAVEVCYKTRPNGAVTILAVWLGDKPTLSEDAHLKAIYAEKAVVQDVISDGYVAQSDGGKVFIGKGVVFRDGRRCSSIAEDEEILFDAVPLRDAHVSGAVYDATCAWIGPKPRLVDRFSLEAKESEVPFGDVVSGIVAVIPNETVALVDVEVDGLLIRVLLFRSSFRSVCERIKDAVKVGDELRMRLKYGFVFAKRKQWFAQVATKASSEDSLSWSEPEDVIETVTDSLRLSEPENVIEMAMDNLSLSEPDNVVETVTRNSDTESTAAATCDVRALPKTQNQRWYDPKSKFLWNDPPLSGVLSKYSTYGLIKHGNLNILVDHSNFYVGRKWAVSSSTFDLYAASGDCEVNFEAVLMKHGDSEFSKFSHEATCVWVGKKPALPVIAMSVGPPNFKLLEEENQVFYGIVAKLCFPAIAIVEIPGLSTSVSIHVNSFVTKPQYRQKGREGHFIGNFVQLRDCVKFKLERISAAPGLLCAREVQCVHSKEISDSVLAGLLSREPGVNDEIHKSVSNTAPSERRSKSSSSSPEPDVCIASAFKKGRLSPDRIFLLNCSGIMKECAVEHAFGSSAKLTNKTLCVHEGKSLSIQSIASLTGRQIRFDAEASTNSNSDFVVTRIWDLSDERPSSEVFLYSDLKLFEGVSARYCPAKVISIPLHDAALATVKNVPVLVPFKSLVSLQEINYDRSSIDDYLNVGDWVGLRFEKRSFPGELSGTYFRAESCWALTKGGAEITSDDEIRPCTLRVNSWRKKWGSGAFFRRGHVFSKHCVRHQEQRSTMDLNIFERGQVFVDGHLADRNTFQTKNGMAITYHVAHDYVDDLSGDTPSRIPPENLYVAWSWIGEEPAPEEMLKSRLAVPKGIICSNWMYELVVESFPLPDHAICRLGYAPVLVPLPGIEKKGKFAGAEDVNLKKGDRIVVRILEEQVDGKTVLIANETALKKVGEMESKDVLKNVSGKVVKLPNPTGIIKASHSGVKVSFELCHFLRVKKTDKMSDWKWFESLSRNITFNKKVYFSAVKVNGKTAPYRAFEVYFE